MYIKKPPTLDSRSITLAKKQKKAMCDIFLCVCPIPSNNRSSKKTIIFNPLCGVVKFTQTKKFLRNIYIVHPLRLFPEPEVLFQPSLTLYPNIDYGQLNQLSHDSTFLHLHLNSVIGLNNIFNYIGLIGNPSNRKQKILLYSLYRGAYKDRPDKKIFKSGRARKFWTALVGRARQKQNKKVDEPLYTVQYKTGNQKFSVETYVYKALH